MPAIGFGRNVTGGGPSPQQIMVTKVGDSGDGTLKKAIEQANRDSTEANDYPPQEILIELSGGEDTIEPNPRDLVITARNLTIRAVGGAKIDRNHLLFDCTGADNVLLTDLRFVSDGEGDPPDAISIEAREGRHGTGFWIDHCSFEAYRDLSITSNTRDLDGAPPLLITVSHCRFHDDNPSGRLHLNHGALGIHGSDENDRPDRRTNAYATVCRNVFDHVRRRSPRSSHRTLVHAFNNLLFDWGSDNADELQQNGMEAGNDGLLVAAANYFRAGTLKLAIEVAAGDDPARLTVPDMGVKQNKYANSAMIARSRGRHIQIGREYKNALGNEAEAPAAATMGPQLRAQIMEQAGPRQ